MLEVVFSHVREDRVDTLRDWMEELGRREGEVLETFRNEGMRQERAFLLDGKDGPVLVYAMEAEDPELARRAFRDSALPVDHEHRKVMREVLWGPAGVEELLDVALPRESSGS